MEETPDVAPVTITAGELRAMAAAARSLEQAFLAAIGDAPSVPEEQPPMEEPTPSPPPPVSVPGARIPACGMGLHGVTAISGKNAKGWLDTLAIQDGYDNFYGRESNLWVAYPGRDTANNLLPGKGKIPLGLYKALADRGVIVAPRIAMGFADVQKGQKKGTALRAVLRGDFTDHYRAHAKHLVASGQPKAIVGVGWEPGLDGSYPHSLSQDFYGIGDPQNFKLHIQCYRLIVEIFRKESQDFTFDWTQFREPHVMVGAARVPIHPDDYYPGDEHVSCGGVNIYDGTHDISPANADAKFKKTVADAKNRSVPWGGDSWLEYFKAKKLCMLVSEWGIRDVDNPGFIQVMAGRFKAWAPYLVGEAYFERNSEHKLVPKTLAGTDLSTQAYKAAMR